MLNNSKKISADRQCGHQASVINHIGTLKSTSSVNGLHESTPVTSSQTATKKWRGSVVRTLSVFG